MATAFFFHSLIIFQNRLCYTYWSTNTFSTNTFTSPTTRKLIWGVSPAKKRQLVDTDTDRASTIKNERGIKLKLILKILWGNNHSIFLLLRSRYENATPNFGWVSSAINKRGFYFGGARSKVIRDAQECIKVDFFWQDWAHKVCRFTVLFGYLTKWEPN